MWVRRRSEEREGESDLSVGVGRERVNVKKGTLMKGREGTRKLEERP